MKNPRNLPAVFNPSGYVLGDPDPLLYAPSAHDLIIEKQTEDVPDSLVIILAHIFNENPFGIRLLLEEAPVHARFPILTAHWELCDQIRDTIEENIRLNSWLFPELNDFSFSTARTMNNPPDGRYNFNYDAQLKLGDKYKYTPKSETVSLTVDPIFKNFPTAVKDAFVRDVGGMVSRFFNMSSEAGTDIAREAMLLGASKILKDTVEVVESRVAMVEARMSQTSRYGEFCNFIRS